MACASSGANGEAAVGNATLAARGTTVFEVMSVLSQEHGSVNLGQGFPDDELEGPRSMKDVLSASLYKRSQQYPPMRGVPELRKAVAEHSLRYTGLEVNPDTDVLVTSGASEALAAAFLGLLNPGDEVICFQPIYDSYMPMVKLAGATPVLLQLAPPAWTLNEAALRAAFTRRTRLLVLNTPHNPSGKVFTQAELQLLAQLCIEHNVVALCDEVYEHLVFPGDAQHLSLRALPGMAGRALRVGSAGKTFSFTGWKVGWMTGPARLVKAAAAAHQFLTFTVNNAAQLATAHGLEQEREFYEGLGEMLREKREVLVQSLAPLGFDVLPAQGTYFLVADAAKLMREGEDDVAFCLRLTKEAGVTLIPVSAFYESREEAPRTLVRFVFCKTEEKLGAAVERLTAYLGSTGDGPDGTA